MSSWQIEFSYDFTRNNNQLYVYVSIKLIFGTTPNSFPRFQCAGSVFLFVKAGSSRIRPPLFGKPWSLSSALCFFLLAGDISPNPGPDHNVTLAFTHIRSINNKYPSIANYVHANEVQAFGLSKTWLSNNATPSFIAELNPPGFSFHHRPWFERKVGRAGFFTKSTLSCSTVDTAVFIFFVTIFGIQNLQKLKDQTIIAPISEGGMGMIDVFFLASCF